MCGNSKTAHSKIHRGYTRKKVSLEAKKRSDRPKSIFLPKPRGQGASEEKQKSIRQSLIGWCVTFYHIDSNILPHHVVTNDVVKCYTPPDETLPMRLLFFFRSPPAAGLRKKNASRLGPIGLFFSFQRDFFSCITGVLL